MLIKNKAKTEVVIAPMTHYHVKSSIHWKKKKKLTESKINEKGAQIKNKYSSLTIFTKVTYYWL